MKYFNKHILSYLVITTGLFLSFGANGQQTKLQLIHNAPGVLLDTVDVYLDGTKFDNVVFRKATGLNSMAVATYRLSVNHRSSADSADQVLFSQNITLGAGGNVIMLAGVDTPANYQANPNSRSTAIRAIHRKNVLFLASNGATAVTIVHGSPNTGAVDIASRPNTSLVANMQYGDTTNNLFPSSANAAVIDIKNAGTSTVLKSYLAPFNAYNRKSLVVFASGFQNPSSNQNGAAFGLFAADTTGAVVALTEVSRIQLINNSPDVILNSIDVWLNNTKLTAALDFRKATPMLTVNSGTYTVTVTKRNSPDTTGTNVITRFATLLESGKTYLGIASGVVDTTQYATNPDGMNRLFKLTGSDSYAEFTNAGSVGLMVLNGTPDVAKIDVNRLTPTALKLANDISFENTLTLNNIQAANGLINITSSDSSVKYGAFRAPFAALSAKTAVLLTSGFISATGNVTGSALYQPLLITNDGVVQTLTRLTSDIQIIHNSPDTNNSKVDIYVNGALTLDNFEFRKATPFIQLDAYTPYSIAVAPQTSASVAEAFYTTNLSMDSTTNYYAIAVGLNDPSKYNVNPNGKDRSFKIVTYKGAQKTASYSKNVDLLFYHGSPDLQTTTIKGIGQVQFMSKDKSYGEFHGYGIHAAGENIRFEVRDAITGGFIEDMFGNLIQYQGKAGIVYASGFKIDTGIQRKNPFILMVAWPDGNVDSIAPLRLIGLEEGALSLNKHSFICYPNPANTNLTLGFESNQASTVLVNILDVAGKTHIAEQFNVASGNQKIDISTASLPAGMYFVTLTSGDQTITQKLLIHH